MGREKCGTRAGYKVHIRKKEPACQPCKRANATYARERRTAKLMGTPTTGSGSSSTAKQRPENSKAQIPEPPAFLRKQGRELWQGVLEEYNLNKGARNLLVEACRTVDRMERMAAALSSRDTLWFELGDSDPDTGGVPIVINSMVGESRQLQNQLRQTLGALGVVTVEAKQSEESGGFLDQLQQQREKRRSEALKKASGN